MSIIFAPLYSQKIVGEARGQSLIYSDINHKVITLRSNGSELSRRGMRELSRVKETFYILFGVPVTKVYSLFKMHQPEFLRSLHFTVYKLALKRKKTGGIVS